VASKNIRLFFSEPVIELLAIKGYDSKMGARPLSRKIDELIRVPLSKRILFDRLSDCDITVNVTDDMVQFNVIPAVTADNIVRLLDPVSEQD
jgi:ATP-dependent Clp protease ATP-binding subunit ClpA